MNTLLNEKKNINGQFQPPPLPPKVMRSQDNFNPRKDLQEVTNHQTVIKENNYWTTSNQSQPKLYANQDPLLLQSSYDIRPKKSEVTIEQPERDIPRPENIRVKKPPMSTFNHTNWHLEEEIPLQGRTRQTFLQMKERITVPENNFKILLKCMQILKRHTKYSKQSKIDAAAEMEHRIQAIAHFELNLTKKVIRKLRQNREDQERMRQCHKIVRYKVNQNVKKFYFETMRRKFIRVHRRRYMKQVAKKFHLEQRKCKCLKHWQRITRKNVLATQNVHHKIMNDSPYAAEILLEYIAYNQYLGKDRCTASALTDCEDPYIPDIVKFHFYCLRNFTASKSNKNQSSTQNHVRIKPPSVARFSQSVEFILRQKQLRVLRCLVQNRDSMQAFKHKRLFRLKSKYLHTLGQTIIRRRKQRFLKFRVQNKLVATCYIALVTYWQNQAQLRDQYETLKQSRIMRQQATYFKEWHGLWAYYSKFTASTYCYSDNKKSRQKFLVKYYGVLKRYWLVRQKHKQNILIADEKFYQRYAGICFQNWAWYSLRFCRNSRYAIAQINKKYLQKFKMEYFNAIRNAYTNSLKIRQFTENCLKRRVIKSLKHYKQFLKLKETVTHICVQKYESNLLRRSFYGMHGFISQQIQLKTLENFLTQKHLNRVRVNVILGLQLNVERTYQKKMDTDFLKKLHDANLLRRILLSLSEISRHRKDLRIRAQALHIQHKQVTIRRHFQQMYLRFCKRNSDRQIGQNIQLRRENELELKLFDYWLRRFRSLRLCDQILSEKVQKATCSDTFKLWRVRMLEQKEFRFKHRCFCERQRIRQLRVYYKTFVKTVLEEKRENELSEAAQWFFWKSKSRIVLEQLYAYSQRKQKNKHVIEQRNLDLLAKSFWAIKRKFHIKTTLNQKLNGQRQLQLKELFTFMKEYAQSKRSLSLRYNQFTSKKNLRLQAEIISVFTCQKLYKNLDIKCLEVHELFKLQNALKGWTEYAQKQKQLKFRSNQVQKISRGYLLQTHLYNWRYSLYIKSKEQQVVEPQNQQRKVKLMKEVFQTIQNHSARSQQKKFAKQTADNFYKESQLTKSLESLRWNSNQSIHRRSLIHYMNLARQKIKAKYCFDMLVQYRNKKRNLRAKEIVLKKKTNTVICYTTFEHWLRLTQGQQIIDNDLDQIVTLYERSLKAKLFKALYEHRSSRILKTALNQKATRILNDSLLNKAFETLAWYALIHKKKKYDLKVQADKWRKKKVLSLWYQVLLKTLGEEGQSVSEVAMTRSTIQFEDVKQAMLRTTSSLPETIPTSTGQHLPQDNQIPAEDFYGSTVVSIQRRTQSQMSFGDAELQEKQQKSGRQSTAHNKSLDIPLQLEAHRKLSPSKSSKQSSPSATAHLTPSDLNTSEELRQAHDQMSQKLQQLLLAPSSAQNHSAIQNEIQILTELISVIKNKYEIARQNEELGGDAVAQVGRMEENIGNSQIIQEQQVAFEGEITTFQRSHRQEQDQNQLPNDIDNKEQDIPSQNASVDEGDQQIDQGDLDENQFVNERAREYYQSRIKLKALASIKLFNQQECIIFCHYPQSLARKVLKGLSINKQSLYEQEYVEADSLLDGAVNQRKMVRVLQVMQNEVRTARNMAQMATQHHKDRQIRIVLFALKKHQLINIMQKTIVQGRKERIRERLFWEWRIAFAQSKNHQENDQDTQTNKVLNNLPSQSHITSQAFPNQVEMAPTEEESALLKQYMLNRGSDEKSIECEKDKLSTSKFGSSLQNEYNFDKNLDDILDDGEEQPEENEVGRERQIVTSEYQDDDDDVQKLQKYQDFRDISAINHDGTETLTGTKHSFVGLAKLAHGLSGELISEVDLASGLPKLEDFKGEEDEIHKIQAEIESSEQEGFQTLPRKNDATLLKATVNFDFRDFDEEYMRLNSIEKQQQAEKPGMAEGRGRAESEARSEIRSVIREANGEELGFDADPQPFQGFNDESEEDENDSLDEFTRYDNQANHGQSDKILDEYGNIPYDEQENQMDIMGEDSNYSDSLRKSMGSGPYGLNDPKVFEPLQQITEAPSIEEATTPGVPSGTNYKKY